jgi:hypothetical protein
LFFFDVLFFWNSHIHDTNFQNYHPIPLAELISLPVLSVQILSFLKVGILISLFFAALGYAARLFLCINFISMFLYVLSVSGHRYVPESAFVHSELKMPLVLFFLLCFLPSIENWKPFNKESTLDTFTWPLHIIKITLGLAYFSAGLQKIIHSQGSWISSQTTQELFLRSHIVNNNPIAGFIGNSAFICQALSLVVIVFQWTFIFGIFSKNLRWVFIFIGLGFHISTSFLVNIHFVHSFCFAYSLIFIEAWVQKDFPFSNNFKEILLKK